MKDRHSNTDHFRNTRNEVEVALTLLAAIVDTSEDAIIGSDLNSVITSWNKSAQRMLGYSAFEMVGGSNEKLIPAERKNEEEQIVAKITRGERIERFETVRCTQDGRLIDVSISATPIKDGGGNVIGISKIIRDLSGRKRMEEARRVAESRYRTLFEYAPDGIFITDEQLRCRDANTRVCQVLEYSRTQITGTGMGRIFRAQDQRHVDELVAALKNGHDHFAEWKLQRQDGTEFDAEIMATAVPGGNFLFILRDLTERRRAEEIIRNPKLQRAGFKKELAIILFACVAIFSFSDFVDPLKTITRKMVLPYLDCMDSIVEVLGIFLLGAGVFIYRRWRDFQSQAIRQESVREALSVLHSELDARVQQRTAELAKTNSTLEAEIVERKKSEEDRQRIESQYRQAQKLESIGQLAGGVAHDFNNILAVIQMQSDLIRASGDHSSRQIEFANEISSTVDRASALTRQLLLFSRREVFQPADMDLGDSIVGTTKILQRTLGEQVRMELKLSPQSTLVHADASMMDQVLLNLAVNARDAMSKGGRLIIETAIVDIEQATVATVPQGRPGSFVCLSVSDTGTGIPADIMTKIFEPFFTTKGVGKGTGLGLATVFGIAQQHQGWINVFSELGRGTTFRFYLPRLMREANKKVAEKTLSDLPRGTETILLAEDDPAVRSCVQRSLTMLGYRVLEAPTGVKALEVWKQNRNDIKLLLTDLMMPDGMTGNVLARHIHEEDPKLHVIYMSAYSADIADRDFKLKEGKNFLSKPFQSAKLARLIRDNLDARN